MDAGKQPVECTQGRPPPQRGNVKPYHSASKTQPVMKISPTGNSWSGLLAQREFSQPDSGAAPINRDGNGKQRQTAEMNAEKQPVERFQGWPPPQRANVRPHHSASKTQTVINN